MVLVPEDQSDDLLLKKSQVRDIPPGVKKAVQLDNKISQLLTVGNNHKTQCLTMQGQTNFKDCFRITYTIVVTKVIQ